MNLFEKKLMAGFIEAFGRGEEVLSFAPGRVNLIGEHIDYNGGKVMPCSLSVGTYGAAYRRSDGKIRLTSADFPGSFTETSIESIKAPGYPFSKMGWAAYPLGVVRALLDSGYDVRGFDMEVLGSLPRSSGLSSSASLEVLTCSVMKKLFDFDLDGVKASRISQYAESRYVGVNCGIMDQFACAMGKRNSAVLLDTGSLDYEYLPFDMGDNTLLVMNTGKPRRLVESKYNERRAECERALELIGGHGALCEIKPDELPEIEKKLPQILFKRVRHVVTENSRTLEAARALREGNMERLGELLNASHDSLKNDYEVTGNELDSIVYSARSKKGVLGARMTGAGFGGCAIAIVKADDAEDIRDAVYKDYYKETGYYSEIFMARTQNAPFAL